MAQRQQLPVDPNDPFESYKAVANGVVVQRALTLNGLFGEMKEWQRNSLIANYLEDLRVEVGRLAQRGCLYAKEAKDFYTVLSTIKSANLRCFDNMRFPPEEFINLILATLDLVKTDPIIDNRVNPGFVECINDFDKLIKKFKRDRRDNIYDGITRLGNALVAAAFTALIILLSVLASFGLASVVAAGVGGYFLFRNVAHAVGHFSAADKQKSVINGLQPLIDKMNVERQRRTV